MRCLNRNDPSDLKLKLPACSPPADPSFKTRFKKGNKVGLATRFQPGQSGNATGRPKILTESYAHTLAKVDAEGVTKAERIAENLAEIAASKNPLTIAAAKELRSAVEHDGESKDPAGDLSNVRLDLLQLMAQAAKSE